MRPGWLLAAASVVPLISALNLNKRQTSSPAVVTLATSRKSTTLSPPVRDRLRRRGLLQVTLDNEQTLYFVNVTLGTPPQTLRLDIDTGSSDIWANSANSNLCRQNQRDCSTLGTYDANKSSTYQYANSDFSIKYVDGSFATGDYGLDTLEMGGMKISNVPFGIGYDSTSLQGILGVGYAANVASVGVTGQAYKNLPLLLAEQKVVNTASFSLWLNDLDANTGSIMFGGVDTDKYNGDLQTLPIIKESGRFREFILALTSLTAANQRVMNNSPIPVLLDTGSSLTYLPDSIAESIFKIFNAQYSSQNGVAFVDCGLRSRDLTVDFNFSGVVIKVPLNELILTDGFRRGKPVCIFGISMTGSFTSVLGDTFLRSAYAVYDLENNQISLAQTNFNATGTNVREIATGTNGVPGAKVVANAVSTLSVTGGGARDGNPLVTGIGSVAAPTAAPMKAAVAVAMAGMALAL